MKKMTKKENFEVMLNVVSGIDFDRKDEILEFLNHEIDILNNRKQSTSSKKTAEYESFLNDLYDELAQLTEAVTVSEFQEKSEKLSKSNYSNQKMSSMFKKLVDSGRAEKTTEKRKSYFKAI
jgi:Zn-dependent M32 family carboxypeptidase